MVEYKVAISSQRQRRTGSLKPRAAPNSSEEQKKVFTHSGVRRIFQSGRFSDATS